MKIDARFCGPPDTANGGYLAGRLAEGLGPSVRVRFRAPTPLDRTLRVARVDGAVELLDGERLLAVARAAPPELDPPELELPARRDVAARAGSCRALETHPFPRCFVCGPERGEDGLGIFPGWLPGPAVAAAVWRPAPEWGDAQGQVAPPLIFAALDCPSSFPLLEPSERQALEPMVLGELAVELRAPLAIGGEALIVAWEIALDAPRGFSGVALFDADDTLCALARATWVSLARARESSAG